MTDDTHVSTKQSETNSTILTKSDLEESIEQLSAYRDRLVKDVIGMGQKLKLPQKQVEHTLAHHPELEKIKGILAQLESQKQE